MKIAISRIDKMGDLILTLPIIQALKLRFPSAQIHIYVSNKNFKILKNFKYINKIFNINKNISWRKESYEYFFNFSPGWKSFFLCFLSKSKKKGNLIFTSRYNNSSYSKIMFIILSKIFFYKTHVVNRIYNYDKKESIHQTEMMFELLAKCKISLDQNTVLQKFLPKRKLLNGSKKICVIHLSSKWINKYYSEQDLLNLITLLQNKFSLALTSDETSGNNFDLIFKKFPKINDQEFISFNTLNQTTIFENLIFDNWIQTIYSSSLIITPECGCSHVAAACQIYSKIIYDPNNKPDMIHAEYHPWQNSYEKFIFNKNLNLKLTNNL